MENRLKKALVRSIVEATSLNEADVSAALEKPRRSEFGDIAFPCFLLSRDWNLSPPACAERLRESLHLPPGFGEIVSLGPFLNFRFDRSFLIREVVSRILAGEDREQLKENQRRTVIVEYSSPNIAKPFHVGHLRSTLIGNCLDRVYRHLGYNTVSINHLGDWGTQFGFVWAGTKLWGKPEEATVHELVTLYRKATSLKERQEQGELSSGDIDYPNVNAMARAFFLDLERGEAEAVGFWRWCLEVSLVYLRQTYKRLDINFDHYLGESFYSDKLDAVAEELELSGLLSESQGALGVDLGDEYGFARIFTPDGRSLYLTRDLAAAKYRAEAIGFDLALYVVGAPQTLHFHQLKGVLKALGHDYADHIIHVAFGHVTGMKTRGGGEIVELNDFLDEAFERALAAYREQVSKRPEGLDENEVAEAVARAAIIFSTLNRQRLKDVQFSWKHALALEGDSGPYVLYAYARINGIREKALEAGIEPASVIEPRLLKEDSAYYLSLELARFEDVLAHTVAENEPALLAAYALSLAKAFSRAYLDLKVVGEERELAAARLSLFDATRSVLATAMDLLGMKVIERM